MWEMLNCLNGPKPRRISSAFIELPLNPNLFQSTCTDGSISYLVMLYASLFVIFLFSFIDVLLC